MQVRQFHEEKYPNLQLLLIPQILQILLILQILMRMVQIVAISLKIMVQIVAISPEIMVQIVAISPEIMVQIVAMSLKRKSNSHLLVMNLPPVTIKSALTTSSRQNSITLMTKMDSLKMKLRYQNSMETFWIS